MSRFGLGFISGGAPAIATMVAGTDGGSYIGYVGPGGDFGTTFGSLSGQPLAGATLTAIINIQFSPSSLEFTGDLTASLPSKTLYIDGTPHLFSAAIIYLSGGRTYAEFDEGTFVFTDSVAYVIAIS